MVVNTLTRARPLRLNVTSLGTTVYRIPTRYNVLVASGIDRYRKILTNINTEAEDM